MITIGFSTRKIDENYITLLEKSCGNKNVQIIPIENNGEYSLSEVYNKILDQAENDIVVLCHDDLKFDTTGWVYKLKSHFEKNPEYGIIGLAGSKYMPKSGMWWEVQPTMYGIVNHEHEGKKWESKYSKEIGNKLEPTVMVDGLFFAVHKQRIKKNFDETVKGFHFYDVTFSFQNYLEGVKVGVCTDIRVTHLSIGQTNEQWESNRVEFAKKFEDVLPVDNTISDKTLKTFIFVHDQDLVELFEENGKFKGFNDYTYVFVGNRPCDKIENLSNVIISRNYEGHLEDYPKLTSFSGWYTLWKHKLIDTEYVNLFEYDVNYVPDFLPHISKMLYDKQDMIGYIPFPAAHQMFIQHPPFIDTLFKTIRKTYRVDIQKFLMKAIHEGNMGYWSSTSNTTFRKNVFDQYMNWMLPMVDEIKVDPNAGHLHERSITIFASMKNKKLILTNGFLKHYQMDSHKTQGHYVDEKGTINQLLENKIQ
jgi:hypothetical protein